MNPVAHHFPTRRTARYFTAGEVEGASEVWFLLHGYSMLAAAFMEWFRPAARPGRLLVAPEGLSRSYYEEGGARRVGASWMTKEDRDVEIEDYVRYLDGLAAQLLSAIGGAPRVEVHGFSQGTATACRWVAFGGIRPRRLMLWCGGVPPDMPLDRYGESLTRSGLTLAFGSRDKFISAEDADREQARLAAAGLTPMTHRFEGGHRVNAELLTTLSEEA